MYVINEKHGEDLISNKEVKLYMVEHFQDKIKFQIPEQKNESLMVFAATLGVEDIIRRVRSQNIMKSAASMIRMSLLEVDFGLQDKFCDAEELSISWERSIIPEEIVTFFTTLFNVKQTNLLTIYKSTEVIDNDITDDSEDIDNVYDKLS